MTGWILTAILAWHTVACVVSASLYAIDKRRAIRGAWRIPETRLHLVDLVGGWPGGWFARRKLRHKTSKARFVLVFWLTATAHIGAVFAAWIVLVR
jgi:uncharacterized membrane protein YsdA (DUF1294 family)